MAEKTTSSSATDHAVIELVRRAQKGDSVAMESLIAEYMWLARSKARKYFLSSGSYDDLLQEGLMGIFKAIRDFDPDKNDNLTAFMSMCIGSQIKDAIRTSSRAKHKVLSDAVSIESLDSNLPSEFVYDPVHNFIEREGVNSFYDKMDGMFSDAQMTVLKYYLDGYTYAEISDLTGMPVKKVDNTLHSIKTKLKKNRELFVK